jgi:hypothetical protein
MMKKQIASTIVGRKEAPAPYIGEELMLPVIYVPVRFKFCSANLFNAAAQ